MSRTSTALILAVSVVAIQAISFYDLVEEEWNLYKSQYNKEYKNEMENKMRMKIFMDNKHKIAKHNQAFERGELSYALAMNQFGDMLHHEFTKTMYGYTRKFLLSNGDSNDTESEGATYIEPYNVTYPHSIDWTKLGAVTPIKNQGSCGSCWSFSATGSLEGQHFRKTGNLVSLSEQNLIDCSKKYGNNGCDGGLMDNAFKYIRDNHGIDTESSYPYEAEDDKCRYKPSKSAATDKGFVDLPEGDEHKLMSAVATVGPISIAIDASHESFQFYSHGIYFDRTCSPNELDHGVLVVGYGSLNGSDYWLVKNSWGTKWGDKGYIKMARNKENHCGVATDASYPLV